MAIPRTALAAILIVATTVQGQLPTDLDASSLYLQSLSSEGYQLIGVLLTALAIGLIGIWRLAKKL